MKNQKQIPFSPQKRDLLKSEAQSQIFSLCSPQILIMLQPLYWRDITQCWIQSWGFISASRCAHRLWQFKKILCSLVFCFQHVSPGPCYVSLLEVSYVKMFIMRTSLSIDRGAVECLHAELHQICIQVSQSGSTLQFLAHMHNTCLPTWAHPSPACCLCIGAEKSQQQKESFSDFYLCGVQVTRCWDTPQPASADTAWISHSFTPFPNTSS